MAENIDLSLPLPIASQNSNDKANLPVTEVQGQEGNGTGTPVVEPAGNSTASSIPSNLAAPTGGIKPLVKTAQGGTVITNPNPSPIKVVSPTAKVTGGTGNVPVPTGVKPIPLAARVNAVVGTGMTIPKGLKGIDTSKPDPDAYDYWHGMIYGETSARKTTTAAEMFGPENTVIILCRQPEQVIPLRGMGYKVLHAQDSDSLVFALMYPERAVEVLLGWPEWGTLKDRHLIFDDITEGVTLLLDRHSTNDEGKERKDPRQIYKFAGQELNEMFKVLKRKKMHLTLIALAKISNNDISNEEVITPDLPPSMRGWINTDLEFVFYIDKAKWKFVTDSVYRSYIGTDEKGKEKTFRREIFGKNKLPKKFLTRGVFPPTNEVKMNLGRIWAAVKDGTPIEEIPGVKK